MQIDFTLTHCDGGVKLEIRCSHEGEYPSRNIFASDSDQEVSDLVNLYPIPELEYLCPFARPTLILFASTNVDAVLRAKEVETEIRKQYKLWKENKRQDSYTAEIE